MKEELISKYDRALPRYTSYPTAPHFHEDVNHVNYKLWLKKLEDEEEISLYFHIPYCNALCWFCGCHTKIINRYEHVKSYASVIAKEVALVAQNLSGKRWIRHIHFGGGSPTLLRENEFLYIMKAVRTHFNFYEDTEIAVEMDPRNAFSKNIDFLSAAGVNRISFGVQDFTPEVQKAINRIQPYDETNKVVEKLRSSGIKKINVDLMYGLPFQTEERMRKTIKLVTKLSPCRVSLFGYAHVPWMKPHQKMIKEELLPDGFARAVLFQVASDELKKRGYVAIGLDHFALREDTMTQALNAGKLHRNFQGYTTDDAPTLLGFGASAIGRLSDGYVQNITNIKCYCKRIEEGILPVYRGLTTTKDDILRHKIIELLMCYLKVDLKAICLKNDFPEDYFKKEMESLKTLAKDGIVELEAGTISITEEGRPFMRVVCAIFDRYLQQQSKKKLHSRVI